MAIVAGMTAFYMFRIYYLIFHWKKHEVKEGHHAPHDMQWTMTLPLIILAVISCVAGFIPFGDFVTVDGKPLETHTNWPVAISSVCIALVGIGLATKMYYKENKLPSQLKSKFNGLWTAAYNRFYMDELYQFITHKIIFQKICKPIAWFDRHIIDGTMNLLADMTTSASFAIRKLQSGSIQSYVLVYFVGAILLAAITMVIVLI
jgi:NADH-quinone oxidoreductase subunit L